MTAAHSVREVLGIALVVRAGEVSAAAARVAATAAAHTRDDEAVHDFRVALRRLRTVLRPARSVYKQRDLIRVEAELRRVARASGALRDDEVLHETLARLELDQALRAAVDRWLAARAGQERARRARFAALLRGEVKRGATRPPPTVDAVLAALSLALQPRKRLPSDEDLARTALERALEDLDAHRGARPSDVLGMHALRIRFKRLRYTIELFTAFYGERGETMVNDATKMQKRLGELHDVDEAITRVLRAKSLTSRVRRALLAALRVERSATAARAIACLTEVSSRLAVARR